MNPASTATAVSSSPDPSAYGQPVTLTATVTPAFGTFDDGGTVQFLVDGSDFGTPVALTGGVAAIQDSTMGVGTHTIAATYSGDGDFNGSTGTLGGGQTINPPTLEALSVSATSAVLTWTPPSCTAEWYSLDESTDGVNFSSVDSDLLAGADVDTVGGLQPATPYIFRLQAHIAAGDSAYATLSLDTSSEYVVPPLDLTATAVTPSRIDLAWQGDAGAGDGYQISQSPDGATFSVVATIDDPTATAYSVTQLQPGTQYYFRVSALRNVSLQDGSAPTAFYSADSNTATASTPLVLPDPAGLTATAVSASSVALAWTANMADGAEILVESSPGGATFTQVATLTTSGCTIGGLATGGTYYFRVRTLADGLYSGYSAVTSAALTVPAPPGDLTATSLSNSEVELTWTPSPDQVTGFNIQQSSDGGNTWSQGWTVPPDQTSYNVTGAFSPAGTYVFRVSAVNGVGQSEPAVVVLPGLPTASAVSETEIDLSWPAVSGATGYVLERSADDGLSWTTLSNGLETLSFSDTALNEGQTYEYHLAVLQSLIPNPQSLFSSPTTVTTWATAPSGLSATYVSGGDVGLAWQDNSQNACGFQIEQSPDGVNWTVVGTTSSGEVTFTAPGPFLSGDSYRFRARAMNADGVAGRASSVVTLVVPAGLPAAPTGLTATADASNQIAMAWSDANGDTSGFVVERQDPGQSVWQRIATVTDPNYVDTTVLEGTTYAYRVFAAGTAGGSLPTSAVSVQAMSASPTDLLASVVSGSQMALTWTNVSSVTAPTLIVESTDPSTDPSTWPVVATAPAGADTYTVSGTFADGQTYYFAIRAAGAAPSPFSAPASVLIPALPPARRISP